MTRALPRALPGQYINNLLLSEFMFYRYPLGIDVRYPVIDIFPFLQAIKYVLLGALAAVSGVLCVDGIIRLKKKIIYRKEPPL